MTLVLELFSGTGSFSKEARKRGYRTFEIDHVSRPPGIDPDLVADIGKLTAQEIRHHAGDPFIVWASPPCTCFSVASLRHYWVNKRPKNARTEDAIRLVHHTVELIQNLNPTYYIIENPVGMMRHVMNGMSRLTVTYCSYGVEYMKPTDLWGNVSAWVPRQRCYPDNRGCHHIKKGRKHPGSSDSDRAAWKRAIVPPALCNEILDAIEGKQPVRQTTFGVFD